MKSKYEKDFQIKFSTLSSNKIFCFSSTCRTVFSSERVLTALHVGHNKTENPQDLFGDLRFKMADPGFSVRSARDFILDLIGSSSGPARGDLEC